MSISNFQMSTTSKLFIFSAIESTYFIRAVLAISDYIESFCWRNMLKLEQDNYVGDDLVTIHLHQLCAESNVIVNAPYLISGCTI